MGDAEKLEWEVISKTHLKNIPKPLPEMADEHKPLVIAADVNGRLVLIDNTGSPRP